MYKFSIMVDGAEEERMNLLELNEMRGARSTNLAKTLVLLVWALFFGASAWMNCPNLYNVLKGEMSFVGPRPLPIYETENLEAFRNHRRYSVLPGLTGLWQISGRNEI